MSTSNKVIGRRMEFVYLFDVTNGNPNGDPEANSAPRIDAETNIGYLSDVAQKRLVRDYVLLVKEGKPPYTIYVTDKGVLSASRAPAYEDLTDEEKEDKQGAAQKAKAFMCKNFWDVRTFGAVMTGKTNNCDRVTGPVQITIANSVEPIFAPHWSITRMAVETEEAREKERTFGSRYVIPYALYRSEGFISVFEARKTGFGEADLELLWEALMNMWEHRHSAARGKMSAVKLFVFKHDSALGNARSQDLFNLVRIERAENAAKAGACGGESDGIGPARKFSDYVVTVDRDRVSKGIELIEML